MAETKQQEMQDRGRAAIRQAGEANAEATTRTSQAGAAAMRNAADTGAELMRQGGAAATRTARHATRGLAEDGRRLAGEAAGVLEQGADRYADALRHMAQDISRLMMVPRSAGNGLQDMQEAVGNMVSGVMRTNLRMTQELLRRSNPGSVVVELQGAFMRDYLDALMEGGTTILRATRRTAEEALRPLEHRHDGHGEPSVAEVMTPDVRVVNPEETVQQAAKLMTESNAGALPVGENDRLIGMVTDRDLALRVLAEGKDPARTKVREVMTPGTHYVFEDDGLDAAAGTMEQQGLRRLPVLNRQKRLVGIVSLGDLARRAAPRAGEAMAGIGRA